MKKQLIYLKGKFMHKIASSIRKFIKMIAMGLASIVIYAQSSNNKESMVIRGMIHKGEVSIKSIYIHKSDARNRESNRYKLKYTTDSGKEYFVNVGTSSNLQSLVLWVAAIPTTESPREVVLLEKDVPIFRKVDDGAPPRLEIKQIRAIQQSTLPKSKWDMVYVEVSTDLGQTWYPLKEAKVVMGEGGLEVHFPEGGIRPRSIFWVQTRMGLKVQQQYFSPEFGSAARIDDLLSRMR
jgi:hypothetical protein